MDTALQWRADHSHRSNSAVAAGKYWTTGWRNPGPARTCFYSRLNRHPDVIRHPAGIFADAVLRNGFSQAEGLHQETPGAHWIVVEFRFLHYQLVESLLRRCSYEKE